MARFTKKSSILKCVEYNNSNLICWRSLDIYLQLHTFHAEMVARNVQLRTAVVLNVRIAAL